MTRQTKADLIEQNRNLIYDNNLLIEQKRKLVQETVSLAQQNTDLKSTLADVNTRAEKSTLARSKLSQAADYYREELEKAHTLLGRVVHQLSEHWDSVRLTKYFPTDNLHNKRTLTDPAGKK